jgi:hypothetical protein
MLDIISSILFGGFSFRPLKLPALALVACVSVWAISRIYQERFSGPRRYRVAKFIGVLWFFGLLHAALVVGTIGHFSHITQHYWGWLFITWCLWGAVLGETLLSRFRPVTRRPLAFAAALTFISIQLWFSVDRFVEETHPNLNNHRVDMVAWINANLPPNARIGAWNAGLLGYFSDRTVVNLDGLANDRDYLSYLESGTPIEGYLRKEGISYIVDVDAPDLTMPYNSSWDHSKLFRNSISWQDLDILHSDKSVPPLLVLRIRDVAGLQ